MIEPVEIALYALTELPTPVFDSSPDSDTAPKISVFLTGDDVYDFFKVNDPKGMYFVDAQYLDLPQVMNLLVKLRPKIIGVFAVLRSNSDDPEEVVPLYYCNAKASQVDWDASPCFSERKLGPFKYSSDLAFALKRQLEHDRKLRHSKTPTATSPKEILSASVRMLPTPKHRVSLPSEVTFDLLQEMYPYINFSTQDHNWFLFKTNIDELFLLVDVHFTADANEIKSMKPMNTESALQFIDKVGNTAFEIGLQTQLDANDRAKGEKRGKLVYACETDGKEYDGGPCFERRAQSAETIGKFLKQRHAYKREQRRKIKEELELLPPSHSFPGGLKVQEAASRWALR